MPDRTPEPPADLPLSAMLRDVGAAADGHVSIGDVTGRFGPRAFGAVLFLFGLINMLPWPPGVSAITGIPLFLIAAQLMIGQHTIWLPRRITRLGLDAAVFKTGLARALPWLERLERFSRPRYAYVFGPVGDRMLGAVCTVLAFLVVLPIPFGNLLPATTITLLAFSLVLLDGLLALVGYLLVTATAVLMYLIADLLIDRAHHAIDWLQRALG